MVQSIICRLMSARIAAAGAVPVDHARDGVLMGAHVAGWKSK
jgi:hypothetical protein